MQSEEAVHKCSSGRAFYPLLRLMSIHLAFRYIIGLILILFVVMFIYIHFSSCVLCIQQPQSAIFFIVLKINYVQLLYVQIYYGFLFMFSLLKLQFSLYYFVHHCPSFDLSRLNTHLISSNRRSHNCSLPNLYRCERKSEKGGRAIKNGLVNIIKSYYSRVI